MMQVTSPSIQMSGIQGGSANQQSNNQETLCFQRQCFGRIITLSNRDAVKLSVGIPAGLSTYLSVSATSSQTLIAATGFAKGTALAIAAGAGAGIIAGVVTGSIAGYVYTRCRHISPSVSPVQLSRIISHAPEANDVPAQMLNPGNDTLLSLNFPQLPPYSPELPPPPYAPPEAVREEDTGVVDCLKPPPHTVPNSAQRLCFTLSE